MIIFQKKSRRQARELYSHLRKISKIPGNEISPKSSCDCGWAEIYSFRFGINFPCVHMALAKKYEFPDLERPEEYDYNSSVLVSNAIPEWKRNCSSNCPEKILDKTEMETKDGFIISLTNEEELFLAM